MYRPRRKRLWAELAPWAPWLLLVCGSTMVGAAILTPAWKAAHRLAAQHQVLAAQSEHLASQQEAYRHFHHALEQRDPVLLQRLAFHHFQLKPKGTLLLSQVGPSVASMISPAMARSTHNKPGPVTASVYGWLDRPMPASGLAESTNSTWRPTATAGPVHTTLVVSGVVSLVLGLLLSGGRDDSLRRL